MENELTQASDTPVQPEETLVQEQLQEQEQEPEHVDEKPDPKALEGQIKELEEKRKKAEADAKYWRDQKAAARAEYFKERPEPPKEVKPEIKEPSETDFDNYSDYVKAQTAYAVKKARAEWDAEASKRANDLVLKAKEEDLQAKIQRGFEKYDDFEAVALAPTVPITQTIKDILLDTDNPDDIAYYLGKNQAETIRISRMSPTAAARAIAKIEIELSKPKPTKNVIPPVIAPIKPIGSQNKVTKDPATMTQKEYEQWRISQGARPY